ncbi:MAG: cytidine deaminase [Fidelibacterota bacterium]
MDALVQAALDARKRARAPFSGYAVGAAVKTADGDVITGSNVENSSLGLTTCAERVALTSALSQGHGSFTSLAVATRDGASPCGACRQLIWDFCGDIPILLADENGQVETVRTRELFPRPFGDSNLTASSGGVQDGKK